jgi:chromosome segregation ATPase
MNFCRVRRTGTSTLDLADKAHMDVEAEITELKRRVTALETDVQGEQKVSRRLATLENEVKADRELSVRLFHYVREIRDDVTLVRSHAVVTDKRIERLEQRMEGVENSLAAVRADVKDMRSDFNNSRAEFEAFRKQLPSLIAETMREVLRDYRGR